MFVPLVPWVIEFGPFRLGPIETSDLLTIVGFGLAAASVGMAARQLRTANVNTAAARRTAEGSFVLNLAPLLKAHDVAHEAVRSEALRNGGRPSERQRREISRYMGQLEAIGILAKQGLIELGIVDRLYGYRVQEILEVPYIEEELRKSENYWKDFIWLRDELNRLRKERDARASGPQPTP